jgi:RNA polymerase sigma factor (sigma-70 family)
MMDTQALVSEYARTGSEAAFRELVSRYIDLVYSSALRLLGGDAQLAEDVSQTVFLNLARKARRLPREVMLGGWLHRDTCYAARTLMRGERRRQKREKEAMELNAIEDYSKSNLENLAPLLDEAIEGLSAQDRTAILLRFFEQRDFRAIGEALGSTEEAARKRVTRAVEKMHGLLTSRGLSLSVAALGAALTTETITAAPVGLAASVAGSALAGAATGAGLSATLIKMATMTKIQAGALGAVVLAGALTAVVVQHQAQAALGAQDEALRRQSAELARQQAENDRLSALAQDAGSRANNLADLVRLRGEVAALRQQTSVLLEDRRSTGRSAQQATGSFSLLQMREEQQQWGIARLNYTRQWLLAFHMYANDNNDQFPTGFEQARQYVGNEILTATNLTTDQFEILYHGSISNLSSPPLVVVLREKQPSQGYDGRWSRAYGFADGHSEITAPADGNYDAWEKRHIFVPPPR